MANSTLASETIWSGVPFYGMNLVPSQSTCKHNNTATSTFSWVAANQHYLSLFVGQYQTMLTNLDFSEAHWQP